MQRRMRKISAGAALAISGVVAASVLAPPATAAGKPSDDGTMAISKGFRKALTTAGISEHLRAFNDIAPDGNRVSGTANYDRSVDYVKSRLEAAGYDVELQGFEFQYNADVTPAVLERVAPSRIAFVDGTDFSSMTFSANVDVTAPVHHVPVDATPGCEASDFAGFPAGSIALVSRGACTFATKGQHAQAAGAVATIVYNNGPGIINGTLGSPSTAPVMGATPEVGLALQEPGATARVKIDRVNEMRTTHNVIAETATGDPDNVVVVGAHLDSVPRGPGINDNGSGSATILEVAEVFAAQEREAKSKLRFVWWGAEEFGLLGSNHYVAGLTADELEKIRLNLNFDMIGSPNYVRFVYDGDNSAFPVGPGAAAGPDGSAAIEALFHSYFKDAGLKSAETPFSGRSDYGPFIARGIPAGGLFTGAEGLKTAEQAADFGGTAGVAYDQCYHLFCDSFSNVNQKGLDEMSDAVAHAVLTYANHDFAKTPLTNPPTKVVGTGAGGEGGGLHPEHDHEEEVE
ncbi:M28 family metallopeptidase [Intrasporangium calvum]|uniref:M28 family metallopeptidase n=1 Tax=Intrasporangium calvum TaxID=53358 RepID=UPI000DF5DDA3|nr:M28 family metallopeptidase [Intrasporangium calvum]AXG12385.1 M20/M25/M40 family metallo-hydrolase [Intrasporangium calvum]